MTSARNNRARYSFLGLLLLSTVGCAGQGRTNIFLDPGQNGAADRTITAERPRATPVRDGSIRSTPLPRITATRGAARNVIVDPLPRAIPPAPVPQAGSYALLESGDITLNFQDATLANVVQAVLGEILERNFSIGPAVTGMVTLETNQPVSPAGALELLREVLAINGADLREREGTYFIEANPDVQARRGLDSIRIVPLLHADPETIVGAVSVFLTPEMRVVPLSAQSAVALAGSHQGVRRIADLIVALDVQGFSGASLALLPVDRADAGDVAAELEFAFREAGDKLRVIPVERINSVLVASRDPALIGRVRQWTDALDKKRDVPERQLFVFEVEHLDAVSVAQTLQQVFADGAPAAPIGIAPAFTAEVTGSNEPPDSSVTRETVTTVAVGPVASPIAPAGNDRIRITPDPETNTLLVRTFPEDYSRLLDALRILDRPPLQVMLETTIAEVTLNDELRYGVEWFLRYGEFSTTRSSAESGAVLPTFPGFDLLLDSTDFDVVLSALDSVSDVEVISSPTLLARDNGTARLQVGDEVPVVTQSLVSADTTAAIANQVEYRNAGIILEFTPRINASGVVGLEIQQEISDVAATTTSGIDSPTIQQRSFTSSVVVRDGQAIALGGLIRRNTSRAESGVPLLADIPFVGEAFKTTDNTERRTELLVLIRPKVIYDYSQAEEATRELRNRLRGLRNRPVQSLFEADRPPPKPPRVPDLPAALDDLRRHLPSTE